MKAILVFAFAAVVAAEPLHFSQATQKSQEHAKVTKALPKPALGKERAPVQTQSDNQPASSNRASTPVEEKPKPVRITEVPPQDGWYKAYILATWILVGVGMVGIVIASLTLRAIKRQVDVMEKQFGEMQKANLQAVRELKLTERPWLAASLKLAGPIEAKEGEIRIRLLVEIANVGRSPAIGISLVPEPLVLHVSRSVLREQKRVAEQAKGQSAANPRFGHMLFPGSPPFVQEWNVGITATDIDAHSIGGFYSMVVMLGVGYRSTIDEAATHCTVTVYDLHRFEPDQPNGLFGLPNHQGVPLDRLALRPSILVAPIAE